MASDTTGSSHESPPVMRITKPATATPADAPASAPSQELPPGWRGLVPLEVTAIEVAPGIRVAPLGIGDFLLPDGTSHTGAGIGVWTDSAAFTEADVKPCRHCGGPLIPCRPGHKMPVCLGWKHAALLPRGLVGPHYCEGRSVNPSGEPKEEGA